MKFSPHSFLSGADFVLAALNEWNESTLLCENDLLCIVPLEWLSRVSFKNHFVDSVAVATSKLVQGLAHNHQTWALQSFFFPFLFSSPLPYCRAGQSAFLYNPADGVRN